MKQTLLRIARSKAFWLLLLMLAAAAGLNVPPEIKQALPVIGPEIATEIDKGDDAR